MYVIRSKNMDASLMHLLTNMNHLNPASQKRQWTVLTVLNVGLIFHARLESSWQLKELVGTPEDTCSFETKIKGRYKSSCHVWLGWCNLEE